MRRQRRTIHTSDVDTDDYHSVSYPYRIPPKGITEMDDFLQMERITSSATPPSNRFENTIEAKVEEGDTLQALALRFHCTVADIKRINKIDKENEIHARKVVKIPVTIHSVLLETLPTVHTSGNNSPKNGFHSDDEPNIRNPLEDARVMLGEKLMVASVNAAGMNGPSTSNGSIGGDGDINKVILNSKMAGSGNVYTDKDPHRPISILNANDLSVDATSPLLDDIFDDEYVTRHRPIRGPSLSALNWSGSDCDMSWVCLFVVILALCFVIPLIYVIYLAEHPKTTHHNNATAFLH